jgi:acetoin utilization protein AcuB
MASGQRRGSAGGDVSAGDLATRNFIHAESRTSLFEIERLMRSARIRHLLIVDAGRLVGVLSYRDVLEFALARSPGAEALRSALASDLMQRDPVVAPPGLSLRDAARRMLAHRVGCLPVVDGPPSEKRVIGLLTEAALLRAAFQLDR